MKPKVMKTKLREVQNFNVHVNPTDTIRLSYHDNVVLEETIGTQMDLDTVVIFDVLPSKDFECGIGGAFLKFSYWVELENLLDPSTLPQPPSDACTCAMRWPSRPLP